MLITFSTTGCYKRHLNKVKLMGLGRKRSHFAAIFFFLHGSMEKFNQLVKKKKKKKEKKKISSL